MGREICAIAVGYGGQNRLIGVVLIQGRISLLQKDRRKRNLLQLKGDGVIWPCGILFRMPNEAAWYA